MFLALLSAMVCVCTLLCTTFEKLSDLFVLTFLGSYVMKVINGIDSVWSTKDSEVDLAS